MNTEERIKVLEDQMGMVQTNLELAGTLMERLIRGTEKAEKQLEQIQGDVKALLTEFTETVEEDNAGK